MMHLHPPSPSETPRGDKDEDICTRETVPRNHREDNDVQNSLAHHCRAFHSIVWGVASIDCHVRIQPFQRSTGQNG